MTRFTGIWPALVTPIDARGMIKTDETRTLVELLISSGIGGLYVCGGTGEGVLLSREQRRQTAAAVLDAVAGRVPVMVHVGALTTGEAVALARDASALDCDAISAVPPFYYAYSFEAIKAHYVALAAATCKPLYVYYIPGSTGNALSPEQLLELCALDGVAGFKYTSEDMYFFSRLMAGRNPERTTVLSGLDQLCFSCQALGADGAIGTTYNVAPRLFRDIRMACLAGEIGTARALQFKANRVIDLLHKYGVIPAIKALVRLLGIDVGQGVPPMEAIEGRALAALEADARSAGLFELCERAALYPSDGDAARGRLA